MGDIVWYVFSPPKILPFSPGRWCHSATYYFSCFLFASEYPISTLPEHLHSTILRMPKLPENTHKPKETSFHPPSTLVPLLANYPHSHYSPPSLGDPPTHPFLVIPSFGVPGVSCLLGRSFTLCIRLDLMVSKLPVFLLPLFIGAFSDCFHALLLYTT